jgi:hypothetical protein
MAAATVPRKSFDEIGEVIRDFGQGVTFSFFVFMNAILILVQVLIPDAVPLASRVPAKPPHDASRKHQYFQQFLKLFKQRVPPGAPSLSPVKQLKHFPSNFHSTAACSCASLR